MNMTFKRGSNPKDALDIGKIHLTRKWLKEHNIEASKIEREEINGRATFYVDVEGDVWLEGFNLDDVASIPKYIKFRNVTGNFVLTNKK